MRRIRVTPLQSTSTSPRKGAGLYVMVLSTSLIVSLIGLTGLTIVRIERDRAANAADLLMARTNARTAVELALKVINSNSNWRYTYSNGVETTPQSLGSEAAGTLSWIVQDSDGNLTDNDVELRLRGIGRVGAAVQVASVKIMPMVAAGPNILSNPGFENAYSDWSESNCEFWNVGAGQAYSGNKSLRVTSLSSSPFGPTQLVTGSVSSGKTYQFEAWIKTDSGSANFVAQLQVSVLLLGSTTFTSSPVTATTSWTKLSVTMTPTWLNLLSSAKVKFINNSNTTAFKIDDVAVFTPRSADVQVVSGSWRWDEAP